MYSWDIGLCTYINYFLYFTTVTIETVGQTFSPCGSYQNMNLIDYECAFSQKFITYFNSFIRGGGQISVYHVLLAFSSIKFARIEKNISTL